MKKHFLRVVLVSYILFLVLICIGGLYIKKNSNPSNKMLPVWNEMFHDQSLTKAQQEALLKKAVSLSAGTGNLSLVRVYGTVCGILFAGMSCFFLYFYFHDIRPISRMEHFAGEIAKGNLDFPLAAERSKTFGAFTWAFDCMRTEIREARKKEEAAKEQNKTMIAGISHDIKTPVANIRNYCEGLSMNLDSSPEKRERYLETIMRKCDEVSALTDDLFLHSLNDMDRLEVVPVPTDLQDIYERVLCPLGEAGTAVFPCDVRGTVFADERRLIQVIDNILGNARKYAEGFPAEIKVEEQKEYVIICIKDSGPGIPEQDFLYAKQKFYRGRNALDQQGAGLGLYLSDVLMRQMEGKLELENKAGLQVSLYLLKEKQAI
ncbi:sensor histidine kinase [Anaerostipes sp.]|uniref:sensor histidine kinase n=1 Tax=Anaerostipes sp. TaxID=1872530 RepID=UPI0025C4E190|nr:HAMP domain-containing sensor histidine kinase [Anaerostipes sp.]MBS7007369.1 HAMP domain-containing histidine kinase [Anaerostipes sp.]